MRKKLLSLLTVLCLVLGMLPATALAAESAADAAAEYGYSEGDIAQYVSEDTEITEDVDGLVLVVAPVSVTISGAKLSTGLMVAPGAEGAKITLAAEADVNAIIVMATADVTVAENAVAASVTVTAPETTVTVAGEVKTVNVAEEAVAATVTVAETAKVETVTVAAPDVKVEVAGTVETVAVAETATGAELVVEETAAVGEVTDATGELTVSGDGAENVTVTDTSEAEEEPAEEEKEEPKDEDDSTTFNPVITEPATHATATGGISKVAPLGAETAKNYTVSSTNVTTSYADDADAVYNVRISATDLQVTTSSSTTGNAGNLGFDANWVGISIPVNTSGNYTYKFYTLTRWAGDVTAAQLNDAVFNKNLIPSDKQAYLVESTFTGPAAPGFADLTDANGQAYHTVYVPAGTNNSYVPNDTTLWAVGMQVYEKESEIPVWSEIFDISVNITTSTTNLSDEAEVPSDEENIISAGDDDADTPADDTDTPDTEGSDAEGGEDDAPVVDAGEVVEPVTSAEGTEADSAPETDAE